MSEKKQPKRKFNREKKINKTIGIQIEGGGVVWVKPPQCDSELEKAY